MTFDITDIDHLMLAVEDSAQAGKIFSRMGFAITPRGQLPGMSNRLICFANETVDRPNFVELMSLDDPALAPPSMAQALKIPNRAVLLVAASSNVITTRERLSNSGMEISLVIDGERDWTLEDGEVIDLSFSIALPGVGQAPFYWIACQHKTPQHYLRDDFTRHENGGLCLSKIIAIAKNPSDAAAHYEKFWSAKITGVSPVVLTNGQVELHIHSTESFKETYPGIELKRTEDHIIGFVVSTTKFASIQQNLIANGFSPLMFKSTIGLDPAQACGCMVVFEEYGDN
ncbi:MAG: VOC family protein [Rhizobiaceae bacterium]|nr:VOC family protein [Rhizobiaceae bacterium]